MTEASAPVILITGSDPQSPMISDEPLVPSTVMGPRDFDAAFERFIYQDHGFVRCIVNDLLEIGSNPGIRGCSTSHRRYEVADVAYPIVVGVSLVGVGIGWAIVLGFLNSVAVSVNDRGRCRWYRGRCRWYRGRV